MALTISSVISDGCSAHGSLEHIVTITGTGFAIGMSIEIGGNTPFTYFVNSSTEVVCAVPPRATNEAATVDVTVTLGAETATLPASFTYYAATLTGATPGTAQYVGGTVLTLTGAGMFGVYQISVAGIIAESWRFSPMDDFSANLILPPLVNDVDGVIVPILGAVDIVATGNAGSVTLNDALTSYQEGRTLFLDGFDYYSTEELPYKWRSPVNLHVAKSGGRRGSGCLTCTGADAELTTPVIASGSVASGGEGGGAVATQAVTLGLAINRQRPEAFEIDFMAGDEVVATLRVTELGSIECVGAETVSLSNILPIGEWVFVSMAVGSGDGGPID
jgi:hypothetical protein